MLNDAAAAAESRERRLDLERELPFDGAALETRDMPGTSIHFQRQCSAMDSELESLRT